LIIRTLRLSTIAPSTANPGAIALQARSSRISERGARDRRAAQLVEVAALDVLDEEQRGGPERRRQ
jgi:hypothetical protein